MSISQCADNTIPDVQVLVKLKYTPLTETWWDNTQGDGFCGWLALIALTYGLEKIHLEIYQERLLVIKKLEEFRADVPVVLAPKIEELINILIGWGELDLPKPIWLPKRHDVHGSLWLGTHDINEHGPFLQSFLKFNAWVKESNESVYYVHTGVNHSEVMRFTYADWRNELFNDDHKHMFYSDSHFYQGPEYSSLWLRERFREATSDTVTNICKKVFGAGKFV